ncbi:MAG: hypothetical protein AB7O96_16675 [Pseudobdellovibrionaceae bacterium]
MKNAIVHLGVMLSLSSIAMISHATDVTIFSQTYSIENDIHRLKTDLEAQRNLLVEQKKTLPKRLFKYRKVSLGGMIAEIESYLKNQKTAAELKFTIDSLSETYSLTYKKTVPDEIPVSYVWTMLNEKVGTGKKEATNVPSRTSNVDPANSSFWKNPGDIRSKNLFLSATGTRVDLSKMVCKYDEPKTSLGTRGGFEVKCDGKGYKLKFGPETYSESFNTRVFAALGYPMNTVENTTGIVVAYDRNIFLEFQSRGEQKSKLTVARIGVKTLLFGMYHNPFKFIVSAKKKDGSVINKWELYQGLFGRQLAATDDEMDAQERIELEAKNYNEAFEKEIVSVLTEKGNLEVKVKDQETAGSWDWNDPVHMARRELRGAGLLNAWVGNIDVRYDNNKLYIQKNKNGSQTLSHSMSDVGAGLGPQIGFPQVKLETKTNRFDWTFTVGPETKKYYGDGVKLKIELHGYAINNFYPLDPNETFNAMTLNDAKWMARKIAQLTDDQIKAALIGSGYDSASVFILSEKLLNRRLRMISDLGLAKELNMPYVSRNNVPDYDPARNGVMTATLPDGTVVQAPVGESVVVKGRVVRR